MRQAIEEGFILDVLKNYINYKVAYKLLQKLDDHEREVDSKKAKIKLNQWVTLHDHNVSQKVKVIVEHYRKHVMHLLGGQAKAMVATSSRKAQSGTFVLDFYNEPDEILGAFQPYYQTAELADVSDPQLVFELFQKLRTSGIFMWNEVEQFCEAFFTKNKSNAAISNICKPAVERWKKRYISAIDAYVLAKEIFERTKKIKDAVLITNAENSFKDCKQEKDKLDIFKKDLGSFVRFYEFMSQIVEYDDKELEKLSLFARHLRPLLHEQRIEEDEIDLSNVEMSHYRLSKIHEQHLKLQEDAEEYKIEPGNDIGTAKPKDKKEEFLSNILARLNDLFITDNLSDKDMINYAFTVRDKLSENQAVMTQIANNTREQAMLGDFPKAIDDAVMDSNDAQQEMMMQYLSNPELAKGFARVVFDMLKGA